MTASSVCGGLGCVAIIGSLIAGPGCGSVGSKGPPDATPDAIVVDARVPAPDAPVQAARCAPDKPFGTPTRVAGINSMAVDQDAVLSDDELTIYFGSSRTGALALYMAKRSSPTGQFDDPVVLSSIHESGTESSPYVTGNQLAMYYAVVAPAATVATIYVTRRDNINLPFPRGGAVTEVNSGMEDNDPYISADGKTLYFDTGRGGLGTLDVYSAVRRSDGSFDTPKPVTEINTTLVDGHPRLSSDGLTIYWSSTRADAGTKGGTDIWTATRSSTSAPFGMLKPVAELNSVKNESASWISSDGCVIYLQSDRAADMNAQDIYQAVKPL